MKAKRKSKAATRRKEVSNLKRNKNRNESTMNVDEKEVLEQRTTILETAASTETEEPANSVITAQSAEMPKGTEGTASAIRTESAENVPAVLSDLKSDRKLAKQQKKAAKREKKLAKYKKLQEYSRSHDIKYQGPLSSFSMSILGWSMLILASISFLFIKGVSMDYLPPQFGNVGQVLGFFGSLSVTFFMTGRLGQFFSRDDGFIQTTIVYGAIALGIAGGATYFYYHYLGSIVTTLFQCGLDEFSQTVDPILGAILGKKVNFNIFIDMFIIALLQCFAFYSHPKWNKFVYVLFRSLLIIPILYFLAGFVLKYMDITGKINLPFLMYLFLPSGSPLTFVAFLMVIVSQKKLKKRYLLAGGSEKQYTEYTQTRHYSWYMAKKTCKHFFFVGIMDLVLVGALAVFNMTSQGISVVDEQMAASQNTSIGSLDETGEVDLGAVTEALTDSDKDYLEKSDEIRDIIENNAQEIADNTLYVVQRMGVGDISSYIIFAPVMLLFCFNKKHQHSEWDILVPIISIAIIMLVFGEGILNWILGILPGA